MSNNILRIPYFATRGLFGGQKSQWITMSFKRYFETGEGHLDFVPRRALMYIPGSDQRKLQKIPNLGCDCAVMDMEDGVAQTRKVEARQNIVKALSEVRACVRACERKLYFDIRSRVDLNEPRECQTDSPTTRWIFLTLVTSLSVSTRCPRDWPKMISSLWRRRKNRR